MSFDEPMRGGATYDEERDGARLSRLHGLVFNLMRDGRWRTLPAIAYEIGARSEASISARLRDFRKDKYGGHTVEKKNAGNGLWRYRLQLAPDNRNQQ